MARILIAASSPSAREQLSRLLASSGFQVFRICASGSELRRALNECEEPQQGPLTPTSVI